jgi:hypothetical protein
MQQLTRRNALLGALGTGAAALAGCVSGTDDPADSADGSDEQQDDGSESTALDASIERAGSDCAGMSHGEVSVFLDDGEYVVQGTIPSPTPCYEPVLDSYGFEGGTLSLTVDIAEEGGACMDCTGEVHYDATVSGAEQSEIDRVSVEHVDGKTYETPAEDVREGLPALIEAEITDSESRPRDGDEEGTAEVDEIDDSNETGTIAITGKIPTETPHYEAVLQAASVRAGTLSVTVDVESTLEDNEMGTKELGLVEYTASAELEHPAGIDSVQISHPNAGYGSSWASDSASASQSASHSDSGSDESR